MYMFVHEFHMWSICYAKCLLFVVKFNWGTRFCLFVCFSSFSLFCSLTEDSISILLQFRCMFRYSRVLSRLRLSRFFVFWFCAVDHCFLVVILVACCYPNAFTNSTRSSDLAILVLSLFPKWNERRWLLRQFRFKPLENEAIIATFSHERFKRVRHENRRQICHSFIFPLLSQHTLCSIKYIQLLPLSVRSSTRTNICLCYIPCAAGCVHCDSFSTISVTATLSFFLESNNSKVSTFQIELHCH